MAEYLLYTILPLYTTIFFTEEERKPKKALQSSTTGFFPQRSTTQQTRKEKMAHRLVTQVIFTGAKVFGRAFTEAYRQAAAATSKQGASAAATAVRDTGISLDEACKILDVQPKGLDNTKIQEKYNYLFDINSKDNGGSFYLQSKIYRAKERLEAELKAAEEELKAREGGSGTSPKSTPE